MKRADILTASVLAVAMALPMLAHGDTADQDYQRGQTLLSQGDFDGALAAFAAAARGDQQNQQYLQQHAMIRRVLQLRQGLPTEKDPQRWQYMARALHTFYVTEGLLKEAVELDRKIHAKFNDATSAVMLAETELAMNNDQAAAEVLQKLDASQSTPATQALLGIALARQGKLEEAQRVAGTIALPKDAGPRILYTFARFYALTGKPQEALTSLERALESTPPSVQPAFQEHAVQCPDFQDLAATDQFSQVLKTKSKVPESQCSGGQGCAGCPNRGQCAKAQSQPPKP